MDRPQRLVKSSEEVIGVKVLNNADENLGSIKEIMLDKSTGQAGYLVLESGSFLGMGGKLFALPWNAIRYDKEEECFRLPLDKEKLQNAPGFDKDHWPDMADSAWSQKITSYYNTPSSWQQ